MNMAHGQDRKGGERGSRSSIEDFVSDCLGSRVGLGEVTPLEGDASDRSYYRVHLLPRGERTSDIPDSLVVMLLSEPWRDGELPFINICRYLGELGLGVPRVYAYCEDEGMLALEDCGDVTLQEAFRSRSFEGVKDLYFSAVDHLITMQLGGTEEQRAACHSYTYAFDEERFVWELNFSIEHWIRRLLGREISRGDLEAFQKVFRGMARTMLDQNLCFTHRDYHSRNLMVQGDRLRILDFQDARLGPPQYDLASLIRDSYVALPAGWEEELLEYYLRKREDVEGAGLEREEFMRVYGITCLQRNLKAIGTFASQKTLRGNNYYLGYIPHTLAHIREKLSADEELASLRKLLIRYVPDF
jgi:hypothetical protein